MESGPFVRLVAEMLEAMDQHLAAARPARDGFVVRSTDGFLFVFAPRPERVNSESVGHWLAADDDPPERLVLFSPEPIPEPVRAELLAAGGTVVTGSAFANLVRQLGIDTPLLPSPRADVPRSAHVLPSVERLEAILGRARSWEESGVPALSLRFYRQAADLKPEYLPALAGVARSLALLGRWKEADAAWRELLAVHPGDPEARLGRAVVLGALGRTDQEIQAYRRLASELPDHAAVHAALLGALVESERWTEAKAEVDSMLRGAPSDPHLRLFSAIARERSGDSEGAQLELSTARALGLTPELERSTRESIEETIRVARAKREATAPPPAKRPPPHRRTDSPPSARSRTGRKRKLSSSS